MVLLISPSCGLKPLTWLPISRIGFHINNLPSSTTLFEHFPSKRPTISYLKPFGRKYYVHIREEEHCSGSKHLLHAREAIIVAYSSSPKVNQVFT
jgi:hypothetical protein